MENKVEDEILKRWEQEAHEKQERVEGLAARPTKRLRELEFRPSHGGPAQLDALQGGMSTLEGNVGGTRGKGSVRGKGKKSTAGPSRKTKSRAVDLDTEADEEYIELD